MNEHEQKDPDDRPLTVRDWRLERKALVSDIRLMIIASIALNQFLGNVQLPTAVSVTAITAAILAPALKSVLAFFGGR